MKTIDDINTEIKTELQGSPWGHEIEGGVSYLVSARQYAKRRFYREWDSASTKSAVSIAFSALCFITGTYLAFETKYPAAGACALGGIGLARVSRRYNEGAGSYWEEYLRMRKEDNDDEYVHFNPPHHTGQHNHRRP